MLQWGAYMLLLVLVLPLIPYAIAAINNSTTAPGHQTVKPVQVPDPGSEFWRDVRQLISAE